MTTLFLDSVQLDTPLKPQQGAMPASVLSIGNFDGVHLGHQAMLNALQATAKQHNLATMVMIFEPQPREYFAQLQGQPQMAPARLSSQDEKIILLKKFGVDTIIVAKFDAVFRSLSAVQFADMLVKKLNVRALVLGDDFRFGHDRSGDSQFLRAYGLSVTDLHTITDTSSTPHKPSLQDTRISSTRIRELLQAGDLITANRLLGHDYAIRGKVMHGDAIGRTLDFPTANIALNRTHPALRGIYGVDVIMVDENGQVITDAFDPLTNNNSGYAQSGIEHSGSNQGVAGLRPHSLFGTANIGVRPSIDKPHDWRLEVFFPKFSGDLYGKTLDVRFLHYLHDERKYDGLEALKAGIKQDVAELLAWRHNQ